MFGRALLAAAFIAACGSISYATDIEIWVDADRSVYLHNTTGSPLAITSYGIESSEKLAPDNWRSIADWVAEDSEAVLAALGPNSLGFQETAASDFLVAEAITTGAAVLQPGHKLSIGRPYPDFGSVFPSSGYFTLAGSDARLPMYHTMPEPSACVLAVMAGLGLFVFQRRR